MKTVKFNFGETLEQFKEPFKKHPIRMFGICLIIAVVLYAVVNIGLSEIVHQNSFDMHMLAAEMLTEVGPNFTDESRDHARMIRLYVDHLDQREYVGVVKLLYPAYDYKRVLEPRLQALEEATNNEEARYAILQAGVQAKRLYSIGSRFSRSPFRFRWFKSEDLQDWLLKSLEDALAEAHEAVNKLEEEGTKNNALAACRANRRSVLRLSLTRLGYDNKEKIEKFLRDIKRAHKYTMIVATEQTDEKDKKEVLSWADSEGRRAKIVEKLLANDIDGACDLLREAIEKAYKKREAELP